ncbi:carbohydrate ABC transporter permease [Liquorilactobacillus satsumensis]|uniref:ABC transporter integral membrane protein n=1 Tax=Liquorilactobacillus satsumensis DSM 16230 = JCM 12392 TaxID=1423801 RepID=A0A0R1UZJ3_9LACO|nr:carbohydrate ABC transporter permease [Liquorilactobacillus satsumensis]KRL98761.1 ABC transporter integral membrane protein [Liquorilactobacillus satsumensis DSM 16230 = JCM 12392]MCP9313126.1 carbohydrate ABC transporter permease [Liquorilactobacillus satsumensis]MCP9328058.1 carbohydrate ABC transporter permease [Liquorilactobacillus satsumensis]MCP9359310.1 carbohydrate ABC transporter permease [Liquorilactobacillus satsumensis]
MNKVKGSSWHILLIIICLVLLLPVVFMVSNSFKTLQDSYHSMLQIIPLHPTFSNYSTLGKQVDLLRLIWNTFFMATLVTLGKIVTGLLAAYAFKYFTFKGKKWLYFIFVSTIFVPFTVVMIPNYLVISKANLLNSALGVALPQLCDATGIMLFLKAMDKIPSSLIEAVHIDGIPSYKILKDIVVPILRPSIISIGAIFFINSWNEYVWPTLILKDKSSFTLPLALQNYISSEGGTNFPLAMALSTIMIIVPLLIYLIFQRYILNSISSSGLK